MLQISKNNNTKINVTHQWNLTSVRTLSQIIDQVINSTELDSPIYVLNRCQAFTPEAHNKSRKYYLKTFSLLINIYRH